MNHADAQRAITVSAVVVAGVYAYRRLTETAQSGSLKNIIGLGNPVPLGQWMTAWGFTFLVIALMGEADPGLGGSFAILVATGDLLANTASLTTDVGKQETGGLTKAQITAINSVPNTGSITPSGAQQATPGEDNFSAVSPLLPDDVPSTIDNLTGGTPAAGTR